MAIKRAHLSLTTGSCRGVTVSLISEGINGEWNLGEADETYIKGRERRAFIFGVPTVWGIDS